MDLQSIIQLLGAGGVGAVATRLLSYRDRRERRAHDERQKNAERQIESKQSEQAHYWRLVDEQQTTIERMRARETELLKQQTTMLEMQASQLQQMIEIQREANQAREARARMHQLYEEQAKHLQEQEKRQEEERQKYAGEIAQLQVQLDAAQGEISRLKRILAENGITDTTTPPPQEPPHHGQRTQPAVADGPTSFHGSVTGPFV